MIPITSLIHERNDFVSEFAENHGRNLATYNEANDRADLIEKAAREVVAICVAYRVSEEFIQVIAEDMTSRLIDAERSEYGLVGAAVAVEVEKV